MGEESERGWGLRLSAFLKASLLPAFSDGEVLIHYKILRFLL